MPASNLNLSHILYRVGPGGTLLTPTPAITLAASAGGGGGYVTPSKLPMYYAQKTAAAPAFTMYSSVGPAPPFHHMLDAATAASRYVLVFESLVWTSTHANAPRTFAGYCGFMGAGVPADLLGIGFYADTVDHKWHTFVRDTPTGVTGSAVSRRDTTTTALQTTTHKLTVLIDGLNKKVWWLIDGVVVDSWVCNVSLDRMNIAANVTGPLVAIGALCPANATIIVEMYGGALPLVRFGMAGTPSIVAPTGGSKIYVGAGA